MRTQINPADIHPGDVPSIEHEEITDLPSRHERARIEYGDYGPSHVSIHEIEKREDFLAHHRPEWSAVRWISITGIPDMNAVHALATQYDLHPADLTYAPVLPAS